MFPSLNVEIERSRFNTYKICTPIYFLGKFYLILSVKTHALEIHQGEILTLKISLQQRKFYI